MNRRLTLTGANIVFFVFTVLFIFFQFILTLLTIVYGENYLTDNMYGILLVNQFVLILLPVAVYSAYKKLDIREVFRLNRLGAVPALIILLLSLPAQFAANMFNTVLVYFLQFLGDIPAAPLPVPGNPSELMLGILIVAVSPAICEEIMHRGLLLRAYEKRGSIKAVIITGILFGIFHFDFTNLLGAALLGILLGYYVIRTNSIFAGMLAHFLNNTIYELFQYFSYDGSAPEKVIRVSESDLYSSLLYGTAGLIVALLLLALFNRVTRGKVQLNPAISSVRKDITSIVSHWPVIVILIVYILVTGLFFLSIILSRFAG